MKRIALILAALVVCSFAGAQDFESLDSLLMHYCEAIEMEPSEEKSIECDFMIGSVEDSLARQHIALWLYDHYVDSKLMGDEAVAIYLYDNYFANGRISMRGEFDKMAAEIFATFNRRTLLGEYAPTVALYGPDGRNELVPVPGHTSILWFYDTHCSKCRMEAEILPETLGYADFNLDFIAVYSGSDRSSWDLFRESFTISNPKVHVIHLWDPEIDSDYQRLYGVMSTPRIYLVEPSGTVIGRRLEVDNLLELFPVSGAIQAVYDREFTSAQKAE